MNTSLTPYGTRYGTRFPGLFQDFRQEVDSLMNRFFDRGLENGGELAAWYAPRADVSETDDAYEVRFDLPGIDPQQIDVQLKHGELWVSGERRQESEQEGKTWHRIESHYGGFQRVVRLGDDVDAEKVDAQYKDGVLRITVPKTEAAQPKRITIRG